MHIATLIQFESSTCVAKTNKDGSHWHLITRIQKIHRMYYHIETAVRSNSSQAAQTIYAGSQTTTLPLLFFIKPAIHFS
jgi:hypothetical protein